MPGVALEGRAVEVGDVAEDPGHLRVVVVPGQQLERLGVGPGQDVGFLDPAEAVDGRAVEGHPLVERVLELGRGDVEPLRGPEHVGEPQLDEADAPLLDGPEHVVPLALHRTSFACRRTPLFRRPVRPRPEPVSAATGPRGPPGNLGRCRTCAWPPRRSTPSSATSAGNVERVLGALAAAEAAGADLCVVPELAIPGYPPEDLLLKPGFVADNVAALEKVAAATGQCAVVVGFVGAAPGGVGLANAAAVCAGGRVHGVYRKRCLPNYGVFDEQRWFVPGTGRRRSSASPAPGWAFRSARTSGSTTARWPQAGRAGRRRRRQPQRVALQPWPAGRAPGDAARPGRRGRLRHRLRQPGRRPGRARLRRRLADRGRPTARWSRRARSSPRTSWSSTCRSAPHRTHAVTELLPRVAVTERPATERPLLAPRPARPPLSDDAEVYAALVLGHAGLPRARTASPRR